VKEIFSKFHNVENQGRQVETMTNMKPGTDYRTLAKLMADFQQPYEALVLAVQTGHILPAFSLNGVPYYDPDGVDKIRGQLVNNGNLRQPIILHAPITLEGNP
jgi:hypothetical protein